MKAFFFFRFIRFLAHLYSLSKIKEKKKHISYQTCVEVEGPLDGGLCELQHQSYLLFTLAQCD